ncbi:Alpha-amylase/alpha-mannosidase [Methylacidimicrobium sp. AP8]|uniref:alpha-amylase/4-alpha-glucanotransferase domain-containing protein n=1 Tax=Methylacidimicrobium sp. AP8 TaxID=2730359 RepID=UPI0018C1C8CD|nr:alpha-amylase/4-alpha-glucanotransferase domain-containing protein [Methylacidimicrobium sp. AP8]CAB4244370.1 Alpha-amylase/alpha-mannosidase [Methylacidimicrobium sp. AP8]
MVRLNPLRLVWVVHFHQPLDNFPETFRRFLDRVCRPFLDALERHPRIRMGLHFSGGFLLYLEREEPELLVKLGGIISRNQVELLGGGFYEPIWSMIPVSDAKAQLRKMAEWIQSRFQVVPRGAWLPESVWEPWFPKLLCETGYDYVLLEDRLLQRAGLEPAELCHPFLTSHLSSTVVVLPFASRLSAEIPFRSIPEIHAALVQLCHRPEPQTLVLAQSAEAFGFWPSTFQRFYEDAVLEQWLVYLENQSERLSTETPGEAAAGRWPAVFLASGARTDLEGYALPAAASRAYFAVQEDLSHRFDADRFFRFLHGGAWQQFLAKYSEANWMHNKMLSVSRRLRSLPDGQNAPAYDSLLAAQEHTPYWHALSGGLFANYLRDAVYRRLIGIEQDLEEASSCPATEQADLDADREPEVILRTRTCRAVVDPDYGGSLVELAFLPTRYNVANTLRRYAKVFPEPPPSEPIVDWHRRHLFQEHFVPEQTSFPDFGNESYIERGDFINLPYRILSLVEEGPARRLLLEREGGVYFDQERRPLRCRKLFELEEPDCLRVQYTITNESELPLDLHFVCEANYTLLAPEGPQRFIAMGEDRLPCGLLFERGGIQSWELVDQTRSLRWEWVLPEGPSTLWHYPVYTIGYANGQFEYNYQGSALGIVWPLHLPSGEKQVFTIFTRFHHLHD